MEHVGAEQHTQAWIFQSWAAFVISFLTTSLGILWLPVDNWMRGFLWMGLLFTVSSCFSLAKTVRDHHEASRLFTRISDAKTEKLLREYELKSSAG